VHHERGAQLDDDGDEGGGNIPAVFSTEGNVKALLDYGFILDGGDGETVEVATQTPGRRLGLRSGDHIKVLGGSGGPGVFLSSSAYKRILFGRFVIRVPVNSYERRSWWWWW